VILPSATRRRTASSSPDTALTSRPFESSGSLVDADLTSLEGLQNGQLFTVDLIVAFV
jgi:hypothetical protein